MIVSTCCFIASARVQDPGARRGSRPRARVDVTALELRAGRRGRSGEPVDADEASGRGVGCEAGVLEVVARAAEAVGEGGVVGRDEGGVTGGGALAQEVGEVG